MTFSIVARCPQTGQFAAAVCSSSPAVAARCIRARAGVGAVASQNITDPQLGSKLLDLMELGLSARQAIDAIAGSSDHIQFRQLAAIDARGGRGAYTGEQALGISHQSLGADAVCAGNLLASMHVVDAMSSAFEAASGTIMDRVLAAMKEAVRAGGEAGSVHSCGVLLVHDESWPVADLRVDWTKGCPVDELASLWDLYRPQLQAYVQRAKDPRNSPSYGVPGEL